MDYRDILQRPELTHWKLTRCLPGQRNAAVEWHKHCGTLCNEFKFHSFQGGTLYRHESGNQFLSVHIDDIILVANEEAHEAFFDHFGKILKLKIEGPFGLEKPGTLFYLKRQISFDEDGLEVATSSKYIPKLVTLLKLQDRRGRSVPSHASLDLFDSKNVNKEEILEAPEAQTFRSALGVCLYISQERLDIQHAVRLLSSYMMNPTKTAMAAVKKLTGYLQNTADMSLRFERAEAYNTVFNRWKHLDPDCKASRKSTQH